METVAEGDLETMLCLEMKFRGVEQSQNNQEAFSP